MNHTIVQNDTNLSGLLDNLRQLIVSARQQALRAIDVVHVQTAGGAGLGTGVAWA